jgi:MoaA/NifB/PqqE/SkfB family radical SAM enzyme
LLCKKNSLNSSLIISGGEIFLENYLFELIEFYKKISQDSPIYLLTNGTLINDKLAQHLKELNINGLQISVDGHTKDIHEFNRNSGSFKLTIEGIKNLVKNNIKFSINCILNSRINSHLKDIFIFCKNLGVKELNFADLLILNSNPLKEWNGNLDIEYIIKNGTLIKRYELYKNN